MKNLIKKIGKTIFMQIIFFSIILGSVALAMTFPTNTPIGEISGGKFMTYFNKMMTSCGSGKVLRGYDLNFDKICDPLPNQTINGICGTSNGTNTYTNPTTNLCSSGTGTQIDISGTDGTFNWSCNGSNLGTDANCSANKKVDGVCNNSVSGGCTTGTLIWVNNTNSCGTTATWICKGVNGGTSGNCSMSNGICSVKGLCGSSNGINTYTNPTTNLCNAGTLVQTDINGTDGTFNWSCNGSNSGGNASCSANKKIDGGWSNWSAFSTCTKTCGTGTQTRTRTCNNPSPSNGGSNCSGNSSDTQNCNIDSCVQKQWITTNWGQCTIFGKKYRQAYCVSIPEQPGERITSNLYFQYSITPCIALQPPITEENCSLPPINCPGCIFNLQL